MAEKMAGRVAHIASQNCGNSTASSAFATGSAAVTLGGHVSVLASDMASVGDPPQDLNTAGEIEGDDEAVLQVIANNKCYLLKMTSEIRLKIWNYIIKEEKAIAPKQIEVHSNKFVPSLKNPTQRVAKGKQLYDEIIGSGLFYQINEFEFDEFGQMLAYLVAITPNRANSIKSVQLKVRSWEKDDKAMHAFHMLANCQGLRNLVVRVLFDNSWTYHLHNHDVIPGYSGLETVRGLDSFTFQCGFLTELPDWSITQLSIDLEEVATSLKVVRDDLDYNTTKPRVAIPLKKIRAAEEASGLNIYGEGRLGPDKKPAIVASRTRAQLAKQMFLNENGVSTETKTEPKFGKFGDLLWEIEKVSDTREVLDDDGKSSVEIFITWTKDFPPSWELLDKVISRRTVFRVARFYVNTIEAYGLLLLIEAIEDLVEECPEKTTVLRDLILLMNKDESDEHRFNFRRLCNSYKYRSY